MRRKAVVGRPNRLVKNLGDVAKCLVSWTIKILFTGIVATRIGCRQTISRYGLVMYLP